MARIKVVHPFQIEIINTDMWFIASSHISDIRINGWTYEQAVEEYMDELASELNWLTENEQYLMPVLKEVLARLRMYIVEDTNG
jgi:hypothetical protein